MEDQTVKIHVLPGGSVPERMTEGAVGFDVRIRAIVSPSEKDPDNPDLRKTLFDFLNWPDDPSVGHHTISKKNELLYRMKPGESVLAGIGFITEMQFPVFYRVTPRGGLSSKYGITVTNAPGTVDPDFRGEAGVLIYNGSGDNFDLNRGMRIAQIIFQSAIIPNFVNVEGVDDMVKTVRGTGSFGSTGI